MKVVGKMTILTAMVYYIVCMVINITMVNFTNLVLTDMVFPLMKMAIKNMKVIGKIITCAMELSTIKMVIKFMKVNGYMRKRMDMALSIMKMAI